MVPESLESRSKPLYKLIKNLNHAIGLQGESSVKLNLFYVPPLSSMKDLSTEG